MVGDVAAVVEEGAEEVLHVGVGVDDTCCGGLEDAAVARTKGSSFAASSKETKRVGTPIDLCKLVEFHQFLGSM